MMKFFEINAGRFVLAAWIVLVLVIFAAFTIGVGAAISVFYHPQHRFAPYNEMIVRIFWTAIVASATAACISSIALAIGRRIIAATVVVAVWIALLSGSAIALVLVRPGPELFERYVGDQRFLIPWHYMPLGVALPDKAHGFSARLCVTTLRGTYDQDCRRAERLSVRSREKGFRDSTDESYWRKHLPEMDRRGARYGHDAYAYVQPVNSTGRNRTTLYYARHDQDGRLVRLIRCYGSGSCTHHAFVGDYALTYDAAEAGLAEWEEMDRRLVELIKTWRVSPRPSANP